MNKILSIQVLRAMAACMVAVHHVWHTAVVGEDSLFARSDISGPLAGLGVDIFFVISGFLMVVTLRKGLDHGALAKAFITSRVERIYPIYMVCIAALFLGAYLAGATGLYFKPELLEVGPGEIVGNFLLLPALPGATEYRMHLPQAWTLVYEMYFYVLFTTCLLVWGRRWIVPSLAVVLGSLFVVFHFVVGQGERDHWVNLRFMLGGPRVLTFLFGAIMGGAYARGWMPVAPARLRPLVLLAGLAILSWVILAPANTHFLLQISLPALVTVGLATTYTLPENRVTRPLVYLGEASYSIYLVHMFVAFTAFRFTQAVSWPPDSEGLLLSLVSIALGCATYSLVERPIIAFFRQRRVARARAMRTA